MAHQPARGRGSIRALVETEGPLSMAEMHCVVGGGGKASHKDESPKETVTFEFPPAHPTRRE